MYKEPIIQDEIYDAVDFNGNMVYIPEVKECVENTSLLSLDLMGSFLAGTIGMCVAFGILYVTIVLVFRLIIKLGLTEP